MKNLNRFKKSILSGIIVSALSTGGCNPCTPIPVQQVGPNTTLLYDPCSQLLPDHVNSLYDFETHRIAEGVTEYRYLFDEKHNFLTLIEDQNNGTITLRPHPGVDPNGWGSSLYLQPFLKDYKVKEIGVENLGFGDKEIWTRVYGLFNYGSWTWDLSFSYDRDNKKVIGRGRYGISLENRLDDVTGDLTLLRISSNYLSDVPLLNDEIGDTGDMEGADVVGSGFSFSWIPKIQPSHFPMDRTNYLSISVKGQYNNVDTSAQGYEPIVAAYKPSLKVILEEESIFVLDDTASYPPGVVPYPHSPDTVPTPLPPNSIDPYPAPINHYENEIVTPLTIPPPAPVFGLMIFGGMYDLGKAKDFWEDNVGITPVMLKGSHITSVVFDVEFESEALPNDGQ